MTLFLGQVDAVTSLLMHVHLLTVHLVLGKVFDIDFAEVSQTTMQGDIGEVNTLDFHALHQGLAEMETCRGGCHGTFVAGKDTLEVLQVTGFAGTFQDALGQRSLAQGVERSLELVMRAIVEEAQGTATAGSVVDDLGHHGIILSEVEFVADTYLAGRIYKHIPQTQVFIEFAEQEDFYLGSRLLLVAIEAGRKDFRVVENEHILFIEIVKDVVEMLTVLYLTTLGMDHHKAAVIAET